MNVIGELRPSAQEAAEMHALVEALLADAQAALDATGVKGTATVQGSLAKDTWIAGNMDVDLFLLLEPGVAEDDLPRVTQAVADAVLTDAKAMYAQHPYLVGDHKGLQVDLVPAYRVDDASELQSAVDRTPFHTAWVRDHLSPAQRDDVRLAKQWMKGVGVYGAETAIAGFSGYLVEVLIATLGSFDALIDWLANGAEPRALRPIQGLDQPATLIVSDPVDPDRNCAAAISPETLDQATAAAQAYLSAPTRQFFFPAPPDTAPPELLRDALDDRSETWIGLWLPGVERLDIVFPQFQKAAGRMVDAWVRAGFLVHASHTWTDGQHVGMQFLLDGTPLPESKRHRGPPADSEHAGRFRKKWQDHADASAIIVDGDRLAVDIQERHRTPGEWYLAHQERIPVGKHVQRVLPEAQLLNDPGDVPSPWSPTITDFILRRRPWER